MFKSYSVKLLDFINYPAMINCLNDVKWNQFNRLFALRFFRGVDDLDLDYLNRATLF